MSFRGDIKKNMKILLVERNDVIRRTVFYILIKEGYKVNPAKDGAEAVKFLEEEHYDILITNLMIAYYSGFEVISFLKSRDLQNKTSVVVFSDKLSDNNIYKIYEMGVDDMIRKPFSPAELICRLNKLKNK